MNVDDDLAADRNKQNVKSAFHIVTGNGARQLASNGLALNRQMPQRIKFKITFCNQDPFHLRIDEPHWSTTQWLTVQ